MSYPLYGNVIIDSSNGGSLGGTLTISNSCNTSTSNNQASIAFAVADTSYGTLNQGLFRSGTDFADVRITALIDNISPTVGTGLSISVSSNHSQQPVEALRIRSNGNVGIGRSNPLSKLDVSGNVRLDAINLQTVTNQTSTQLGYTIRNTLPNITFPTNNTWLQPTGNAGQITLASQGVYLLSYSFSTKSNNVLLMGCLSDSSSVPYTSPTTIDGSNVLCFSGSENKNANWITCSNTIVHVNTTENRTIYLWWASNSNSTVIKTYGNYFQAVRIA